MFKSWIIVGMNCVMDQFFELLESDFINLLSEGYLVEKMVGVIYCCYNEDIWVCYFEFIFFCVGCYVIVVCELCKKVCWFWISLKNLFIE